jgi:hypothetical protein
MKMDNAICTLIQAIEIRASRLHGVNSLECEKEQFSADVRAICELSEAILAIEKYIEDGKSIRNILEKE